jgi:bifunctional UDP-N-acetylglucosamine pyrophosphorylase / glucosamine-1-phosphate N-acetyltransferase
VGADTVIEPCAALLGGTRIGEGCCIGRFAVVADSELADHVTIAQASIVEESKVESGAVIGPFARLRMNCEIGPDARIGNFVEVKKTKVGRGTKAQHLTYLGDATLGENVNIGAGTITVNYDPYRLHGEKKQPTVVEDEAFIGSGTNLIAPVRVGRHAFVAAGSTITDEVPPEALSIGRGRQVNKPGWVRERKAKKEKKTKIRSGAEK